MQRSNSISTLTASSKDPKNDCSLKLRFLDSKLIRSTSSLRSILWKSYNESTSRQCRDGSELHVFIKHVKLEAAKWLISLSSDEDSYLLHELKLCRLGSLRFPLTSAFFETTVTLTFDDSASRCASESSGWIVTQSDTTGAGLLRLVLPLRLPMAGPKMR